MEQDQKLKNLLFLVGGWDDENEFNSVQCFDFEREHWTSSDDPDYLASGHSSIRIPSFPFAGRSDCQAVLANNNRVYLVGGDVDNGGTTAETLVFDTTTREWSKGPEMNQRREQHGLVHLNGRIFAIGGYDDSLGCLQSCEILPISAGQEREWKQIAPLNNKRNGLCAVSLRNHIYAIGGLGDDEKSVERYDEESGKWTLVAEMNERRGYHSASVLDNRIYVAGGDCGKNTCEYYDRELDRWTVLSATLNIGRHWASMISHNGSLYIVGGRDKDLELLSSVERYQPSRDNWTQLDCQLKTPICMAASVLI